MPPNAMMTRTGPPPFPAGSRAPAGPRAAHSTTRREALKLLIGASLPALLGRRAALAATPEPTTPTALDPGGEAVASAITDGDTLTLEDGREVRLVGIQAPKLPLGRPDFPTWPLAEDAKAALGELALGRRLRLYYGGAALDRYGRALAHLVDESGVWIQGAMIERGMARTYSFADNRALVPELLRREAAARAERRGIWALAWYRVRRPEETVADIDSFQLVEGRVLAVAERRAHTYLNFGADWRTDFTLSLDARARRLFERAALPPAGFEGRRLRARGWIESFNGPLIEITHPEQIEVLE
jgi:endonuclease YncB( thermonuclease family)